MTTEPSEFERDVDLLTEMIRSDGRPSPEQTEAASRVFRHTLVNIASVAQSLRRIADAQELEAAVAARASHAELPTHKLFDWRKDYQAVIGQTED
jgi:hypothetical protein